MLQRCTEILGPVSYTHLDVYKRQVQAEYTTGAVISRFLTCAQEKGKSYDFYQTYIEIL